MWRNVQGNEKPLPSARVLRAAAFIVGGAGRKEGGGISQDLLRAWRSFCASVDQGRFFFDAFQPKNGLAMLLGIAFEVGGGLEAQHCDAE